MNETMIPTIRHEAIWWKQLLLIVTGVVLVSSFGALLISPTGAGSDGIFYAVLAAYAIGLVLLGPKFTKITGLVLLCIFLGGFVMSTINRNSYLEELRARRAHFGQMRTSDGRAQKSNAIDGEHKEADSRPVE